VTDTVHHIHPRVTATCRCCEGLGDVTSAEGLMRPCSRCREPAFRLWAKARAPMPPPAPHPAFDLTSHLAAPPPHPKEST
jgi:hypothetical protein